MTEWLRKHEHTVCHELCRQGMISKEVLKEDLKFCTHKVPEMIVSAYKLVILPVVFLMKVSPSITRLVFFITKKVWFQNILEKNTL